MYCLTDCIIGHRCFRLRLFFSFLSLLILFFTSCTRSSEPYSILEFKGKGDIYNYSRSLFPILYESDSVNSTALLASKGDIIVYGDNSCFYYRESSRKKFSIKTSNNEGFINGKVNSVRIRGNNEMIPWFKHMKSTDIPALGFLYFDTLVSENYIPYLTDLAETNPDIGLGYEGTLKDLERIFEMFKPKFIIGINLTQKDFNLLSGLASLEIFSASLNDSINLIPLPAMPELKQLILTNIKKNTIISDDFLINNKQIERLTIMGSDKFNILLIKPLDRLKELIINGFDTIENYDLIKNFKQIELLSVTGEKSGNDITLKELPKLRWMIFHEDATQELFNSVIESHPDLEVVELINNDTIKNLQPLFNLRKFYGLTITDTITDLAAVKSLKNLKYLSIPYNILNDSIIKADLQRSLPDTKIVANQGVCLGSGWLLLIIPLILVLRVLTHQKSRKVQDSF